MAVRADTAAVTNNTPSCTISRRASSPTSISSNYAFPLLSAFPAPTRPATVICVRIRQIKKYNALESAISRSYWTQSLTPRASCSSLAYCLRWLITSQPLAAPFLPPEWKNRAVMTICNINLIGLTVSLGVFCPALPPLPVAVC